METVGPILGNPLLIAAIILFLALLPRALRQGNKTTLEKAVERFEKEELQDTPIEDEDENERNMEARGEISAHSIKDPIFKSSPDQNKDIKAPAPVSEKKVKIVKEGIPISHNDEAEPSPIPQKKAKVIKEGFSISHNEEKVSPAEDSPPPHTHQKNRSSKAKESSWDEDFKGRHDQNIAEEESSSNWVEAEIPGLIMDPIPEETTSKGPSVQKKSKDMLVFKASPKTKLKQASKKNLQKPKKPPPPTSTAIPTPPKPDSRFGVDEFEDFPSEENLSPKVKDSTTKTVEKKSSKPKEPAITGWKADQGNRKISGPELKPVEIKPIVVSHKDIAKNKDERERSKSPHSRAELPKKTEPEIKLEVISQQNDSRGPEVQPAKPKPFFLDLKYLIEEELESETSEFPSKLSPEMVNRIVTKLNELQVDLENQFAMRTKSSGNEGEFLDVKMRKNRLDQNLPAVEPVSNDFSGKKEVSLEELDSFLFTTTQRVKNRE
ncbi:MAG: hypothetical protein OEZ51_10590 [Nitrospinota bacterium]|nr:hypothetical protein [Nitrospinota bacterium]